MSRKWYHNNEPSSPKFEKKFLRVKFQLQRMGNNVVMEGKLMNGTYVNGLKLGKGKQHSLDQGDTISMLQMDFEVVLYMLLSGTQPFRDSDAEALKQKIMTGQYQEMSGVRWGSHIQECQGPYNPVVGGGPKWQRRQCPKYT